MNSEMQVAVTFQESSVCEFVHACNTGNFEDVVKYMHPAIHFQSYMGGLPDMVVDGVENLCFYLEGRSAIQDPHYSLRKLEINGAEVRIAYECFIKADTDTTRTFTGTMICVFANNKIMQILDAA